MAFLHEKIPQESYYRDVSAKGTSPQQLVDFNAILMKANLYTADVEVTEDTDDGSIAPHDDFFTPVEKLARHYYPSFTRRQERAYQAIMFIRKANGLDISPAHQRLELPARLAALVVSSRREDAQHNRDSNSNSGWSGLTAIEVDGMRTHNDAAWDAPKRESEGKSVKHVQHVLEELDALETAKEPHLRTLSPLYPTNMSAEDSLAELEALEAANEPHWRNLSPLAPSDMDYSFVSADYSFLSAEEKEEEQEEVQKEEVCSQEEKIEIEAMYNPGGLDRVAAWRDHLARELPLDEPLEKQSEESEDETESETDADIEPAQYARTWLQSPLQHFTPAQLAELRVSA